MVQLLLNFFYLGLCQRYNMLEAKELCCTYEERQLFKGLNFHLAAGEILQVEGANGAGKTTLLRMLTGIIPLDEGQILWRGKALFQQREEYYRHLLYLGHKAAVKSLLTAEENLRFYHSFAGKTGQQQIWQALASVGLTGYEDVPLFQLSAGQQRRVALARLWLTNAPLWILDEPFTAIDKEGVAQLICHFAHHLQQGGSIVLTSHQEITNLQYPVRKVLLGRGVA